MDVRQCVMSSLGVHHVPIAVLGMEVLSHHQRGDVSIASSWESDLDSLSVFARIVWENQHFVKLPRTIAIHCGIPHRLMESIAYGSIIMNQ